MWVNCGDYDSGFAYSLDVNIRRLLFAHPCGVLQAGGGPPGNVHWDGRNHPGLRAGVRRARARTACLCPATSFLNPTPPRNMQKNRNRTLLSLSALAHEPGLPSWDNKELLNYCVNCFSFRICTHELTLTKRTGVSTSFASPSNSFLIPLAPRALLLITVPWRKGRPSGI